MKLPTEEDKPTEAIPETPIRALALKLTYAQQFGAGDLSLEVILTDYLKESGRATNLDCWCRKPVKFI